MLPNKRINRLKELVCVIFGHDWNGRYERSTEEGHILEERVTCDFCKLTNIDESGFVREFERWYEKNQSKNEVN